jgi:hypothetical protein
VSRSLSTTWRFVLANRWKGNDAYDIWFDPTSRVTGQDTGAEIMRRVRSPARRPRNQGIRCVVSVWPAAVSRPASVAPIAVAGVRTPPRPGRRSPSSARQSALSPNITEVAA